MDPLAVRRSRPFSGRSQLALELALLLYAAIASLVVVRLVLLAFSIDDRLWIGRTFLRFTNPLVGVLARLPGAERGFLGEIALPDLTLAALVALVPLGIIARGRRATA